MIPAPLRTLAWLAISFLLVSPAAAVCRFGESICLGVVMVDANGTPIANSGGGSSSGSPGSTGVDYSANAPAIPAVGASFAASGPYASYVLIKTIPALSTRANVDVENTSGAQILVIRDDGTAAAGSAPANASLIPLSTTGSAGQQGGSWASTTFRGRLQIYAPASTAQVAAFVD